MIGSQKSLNKLIEESYHYPSRSKSQIETPRKTATKDNSLDNPTFIQFLLRDNKYVFGGIVSVLSLTFGLVRYHRTDANAAVILVMFFVVSTILTLQNAKKEFVRQDAVEQRFDDIETDTVATQFVLKNNVNLSKSARLIKHIRNHPDIMMIIGRLQRYETYDEGVFATVVSALERFLRYYEAVLMNRAPCDNTLRHMTDLRAELLNQMSFLMSFNVKSTDVEEVRKLSAALQSKTRRFMKIVSRKCESTLAIPGIFTFLDGVDCANANDPNASVLEMY